MIPYHEQCRVNTSPVQLILVDFKKQRELGTIEVNSLPYVEMIVEGKPQGDKS